MPRSARFPLLATMLAAAFLPGLWFVAPGFAGQDEPEPQAEAAPAPADEEPPMEYALELDGQTVDLQLDRETTSTSPAAAR